MPWLLVYVLVISLYDLHTRRIPNWYTFPLIFAGVIAHFPGHLDVWFASFVLLLAWVGHWIGAGDTKLWLAVLWALPDEQSSQAFVFMATAFFFAGLAQILWRIARKQSPTHQLTPGAWRTILFLLLSYYVH